MIRHKPSEKRPEVCKRVVINLSSPQEQFSGEWHFGMYLESVDIWKVWQAYGLEDGPRHFGTSKILWWGDPMEEE